MKKIFIFFAVLIFFGEIVNAATLEQEKSMYDSEAEKARQAAESLQIKIESVSEVKRKLDEDAAAATLDYDNKQAALDKTLSEIAENEKKLSDLQIQHEEKQKIFEKRVRDIYINGQISYVDVIFGAKDFNDFLTRMDLLKRVIAHDSELVTALVEYQNEVKEIVKILDEDKKVQEDLVMKAEQAKNIKLEKVAAQQEIIDKMETDREYFNQQYAEKLAASEQIAKLIEENRLRAEAEAQAQRQAQEKIKNQTQGYVSTSDKIIMPAVGEITSPYGTRTHPIFGTQIFHSGLDIGADYGDEIHAAQSGTVLVAGWIDGYGNTVMIDHDGGLVTLYGHNQSLAVSVGQTVRQGQVIAYCGSTGNSTGPHCHFEVRLHGEPVNPNDYLQ